MSTGDSRPGNAEVAFRIGLTVFALACFYGGYYYFQRNLHPPDFASPAPAGYLPGSAGQSAGRDIVFPWPQYPGAEVLQRHEIELEPHPLQQQMLEIAAAPEQIVDFYRRRLLGKGYADVTDHAMNLNPQAVAMGGHSGVSLNSEGFARGYDRMRRSLLLMRKGDRTIMVRIQPGPKSWKHSVHLMAFPQHTGEKLAARNRGRDIGGGVTEISLGMTPREMGGETYSTTFYQGRMGVSALYDRLRDLLEGEGWVLREYGDEDHTLMIDGSAAGYFKRRNEDGVVFVAPDKGRGGSSFGSITTIRATR